VSIAVSTLKAKQDTYDARSERLLQHFTAFRDGFLARLEEFTRDALAAGLRGVQQYKRRTGYDDRVIADVMLNHFPLVIVSSNEIWPLDRGLNELAARILMYYSGIDHAELVFDILGVEVRGSIGGHQMRRFSSGSDMFFPFRSGELSEEDGRSAAYHLIELIYEFRHHWNPKPSLQRQLERSSPTDSIGFKLP
jgi:hypothetical protein